MKREKYSSKLHMQTQKYFRVIRLLQASLRVMTQKNDAKCMTQSDHVNISSFSDERSFEGNNRFKMFEIE
jgi:hypothetical protein